jgi:hypothetical protein
MLANSNARGQTEGNYENLPSDKTRYAVRGGHPRDLYHSSVRAVS